MEPMRIFAFPANYEVLDDDVNDSARVAPISPDGLTVGIGIGGRCFAVVLPAGNGGYGSRTFLATTPDPDSLLVAAAGEAYLVTFLGPSTAAEPIRVTSLNCYAASACAAFPTVVALIVVDLTRMICLDKNGIAWVSSELSDDALRYIGQDADHILLEAYSAAEGKWSIKRLPVSPETPL